MRFVSSLCSLLFSFSAHALSGPIVCDGQAMESLRMGNLILASRIFERVQTEVAASQAVADLYKTLAEQKTFTGALQGVLGYPLVTSVHQQHRTNVADLAPCYRIIEESDYFIKLIDPYRK